MRGLQPGPPVGRGDVAHVGDRLCADLRGRREAPAHHRQHPVAVGGVDHGRHLVGEDPGQRRQVAGLIAVDREGAPDLVLEAGGAVEIAHGRDRSLPIPSNPLCCASTISQHQMRTSKLSMQICAMRGQYRPDFDALM